MEVKKNKKKKCLPEKNPVDSLTENEKSLNVPGYVYLSNGEVVIRFNKWNNFVKEIQDKYSWYQVSFYDWYIALSDNVKKAIREGKKVF